MHISEGILSAPVLLGGGVLATAATGIGLKKIDYEHIMSVALLTAAFFVASLVHVPVGPGSAHLVLIGLLGIILGWASVPAILVALLLQAVFFQFGGLLVLGVNTCIMGLPAVLVGQICSPLIKHQRLRPLAGFLAGFLAILFAALLAALALALSDQGFLDAAKILLAVHIPVMIVEGIITMAAVSFLARVQPDLLHLNQQQTS